MSDSEETTNLPKGRDVSVPLEEIIMQATGLSLVMMIVPLLIYIMVWGWQDLFAGFNGFVLVGLVIFFTLWHEGFHAIGWKYWGNLEWRDLKFGFAWRALAPYCHAKAPMQADAYRFGAALPGVMTGLVPFLGALVIGNGMMAIASAVMISGAVGDVYVLWVMREVPQDAIVMDHPSNAGCIVVKEGTRT